MNKAFKHSGMLFAYCLTGEGGGIDNSCSSRKRAKSTMRVYLPNGSVNVQVNPPKSSLKAIFDGYWRKHPDSAAMRILVDIASGDVFVWDSWLATHDDIISALGGKVSDYDGTEVWDVAGALEFLEAERWK